MITSTLVAALAALAGAPPGPLTMDCDAAFQVPPTDFEGGVPLHFEYEVAIEPSGTALPDVEARARGALITKLCRADNRDACAPLHAGSKILLRGSGRSTVCAMAGLLTRDVDRWRASQVPHLREHVLAAIAQILPKKKRVAVDKIVDGGAAGGLRAEWLRGQIEAALAVYGATVVDVDPRWSGRGVPKGAERMLRGQILQRVDPVKQLPIIEVQLTAYDGTLIVTKKTADPFEVSAAALPRGPSTVGEITARGDVTVHIKTRPDGNLCFGDRSTVFVANSGTTPLHARVFNLDADGNAIQLFPNADLKTDVLSPGKPIPVADVEVQGDPDSTERYVVVAAPTVGELGRYATASADYCKLKKAEAKAAAQGEGFSQPHVAHDSFRVLPANRCNGMSAKKIEGTAASLEALPFCE